MSRISARLPDLGLPRLILIKLIIKTPSLSYETSLGSNPQLTSCLWTTSGRICSGIQQTTPFSGTRTALDVCIKFIRRSITMLLALSIEQNRSKPISIWWRWNPIRMRPVMPTVNNWRKTWSIVRELSTFLPVLIWWAARSCVGV